jgi:SAM-dependent methyltransferase
MGGDNLMDGKPEWGLLVNNYLTILGEGIPLTAGSPYKKDKEGLLSGDAERRYIQHSVFDIPYRSSRIVQIIKKYRGTDNLRGLSLLDIGCGDGCMASYIHLTEELGLTCGSELDSFRITCFRKATKDFFCSTLLPIRADANVSSFKTNTFDIILMIGLITNVHIDVITLVKNAYDILKDGGTLLINFFNRFYPFHQKTGIFGLNYLPRAIAKIYAKKRGVLAKFSSVRIYNPFSLQRQLYNVGFQEMKHFSPLGGTGPGCYLHSVMFIIGKKKSAGL